MCCYMVVRTEPYEGSSYEVAFSTEKEAKRYLDWKLENMTMLSQESRKLEEECWTVDHMLIYETLENCEWVSASRNQD